jgi:hypothetical protein
MNLHQQVFLLPTQELTELVLLVAFPNQVQILDCVSIQSNMIVDVGDIILLYTDKIIAADNLQQKRYENEQFCEILEMGCSGKAAAI